MENTAMPRQPPRSTAAEESRQRRYPRGRYLDAIVSSDQHRHAGFSRGLQSGRTSAMGRCGWHLQPTVAAKMQPRTEPARLTRLASQPAPWTEARRALRREDIRASGQNGSMETHKRLVACPRHWPGGPVPGADGPIRGCHGMELLWLAGMVGGEGRRRRRRRWALRTERRGRGRCVLGERLLTKWVGGQGHRRPSASIALACLD